MYICYNTCQTAHKWYGYMSLALGCCLYKLTVFQTLVGFRLVFIDSMYSLTVVWLKLLPEREGGEWAWFPPFVHAPNRSGIPLAPRTIIYVRALVMSKRIVSDTCPCSYMYSVSFMLTTWTELSQFSYGTELIGGWLALLVSGEIFMAPLEILGHFWGSYEESTRSTSLLGCEMQQSLLLLTPMFSLDVVADVLWCPSQGTTLTLVDSPKNMVHSPMWPQRRHLHRCCHQKQQRCKWIILRSPKVQMMCTDVHQRWQECS